MNSSETAVKDKASNIANKILFQYPNLKTFFEILLRNVDIETKKVGTKFQYPKGIIQNNLYSNYGIFIDYFIRKLLSNKYQTKISDDVTEQILMNAQTYFTGRGKDHKLQKKIQEHYMMFKDPQNKAMDILESIKIVSLSYTMSFHDPLPKAEIETDDMSLLEVIQYFEKLPYSEVKMKSSTNCDYFDGNADLIFDQKVLYEIKTSKFPTLSSKDTKFHVRNFYKLILYGFGYYKETGIIIKCFKIYNPLLGLEFTLKLNDIDMNNFEKVLKKDFENKMTKSK